MAFALLFGFFVAGVATYTPPGSDEKLWFVTPDKIEEVSDFPLRALHFPLTRASLHSLAAAHTQSSSNLLIFACSCLHNLLLQHTRIRLQRSRR